MDRHAYVSALGLRHLAVQSKVVLITLVLGLTLLSMDAFAQSDTTSEDRVRYAGARSCRRVTRWYQVDGAGPRLETVLGGHAYP